MLRLLCLLLILSTPASAHTIWATHLTDDTNTANGSCNLREAILAANTNTTVDACPAGGPLNADDGCDIGGNGQQAQMPCWPPPPCPAGLRCRHLGPCGLCTDGTEFCRTGYQPLWPCRCGLL